MAFQKAKLGKRSIEDTRLIFRNFTGAPSQFNAKGDRNVGVLLDPETAAAMEAEGWNVKYLKHREGDDPNEPQQAWIKAKVSYAIKQPKIFMITSRGKSPLGEDELQVLDFAEFQKIDVMLEPSFYEMNGKTGYSCYVSSLYATIVEDELDLKYADVETDKASSAQSARPHFDNDSEEVPY